MHKIYIHNQTRKYKKKWQQRRKGRNRRKTRDENIKTMNWKQKRGRRKIKGKEQKKKHKINENKWK